MSTYADTEEQRAWAEIRDRVAVMHEQMRQYRDTQHQQMELARQQAYMEHLYMTGKQWVSLKPKIDPDLEMDVGL